MAVFRQSVRRRLGGGKILRKPPSHRWRWQRQHKVLTQKVELAERWTHTWQSTYKEVTRGTSSSIMLSRFRRHFKWKLKIRRKLVFQLQCERAGGVNSRGERVSLVAGCCWGTAESRSLPADRLRQFSFLLSIWSPVAACVARGSLNTGSHLAIPSLRLETFNATIEGFAWGDWPFFSQFSSLYNRSTEWVSALVIKQSFDWMLG